jgi:hypothetical protein
LVNLLIHTYAHRTPFSVYGARRAQLRRGMGYPHPYFVNKFLVFIGLQVWLRCKIVKTKELFAKSSRIRSYGTIGGRVEGKLLCMIVQQSWEMICNHLRWGQLLAIRSHGLRGNSKEIRGQRSGVRNALVEVRGLPTVVSGQRSVVRKTPV